MVYRSTTLDNNTSIELISSQASFLAPLGEKQKLKTTAKLVCASICYSGLKAPTRGAFTVTTPPVTRYVIVSN